MAAKEVPAPRGPAVRPGGAKPPTVGGFVEYLRGVREELMKAKWPDRAELIRLTQVVLAVMVVVALYVGGLDALLSWMTTRFFGYGQ